MPIWQIYPRNVFDVLQVFWTDFSLRSGRPHPELHQPAKYGRSPRPSSNSSTDWASVRLRPASSRTDSFSCSPSHHRRKRTGRDGGLSFSDDLPDVHPVAIVRSEISGAILRRLGVEVRLCNLGRRDPVQESVRDLDLLVDFSVSQPGEVSRYHAHYDRNITRALESTRGGARYVFASSINAFGMSRALQPGEKLFLPHTLYAYTKRYGERLTVRTGKRLGKETYIFRLGHVHGLAAAGERGTRHLVRGHWQRFEYPDTLFVHDFLATTIAEGLISAAKGGERARHLHSHLRSGVDVARSSELLRGAGNRIQVGPATGRETHRSFCPRRRALRSRAMQAANDYRETIRTNVLRRFPSRKRAAARLYDPARRAADPGVSGTGAFTAGGYS